MKTTSHHSQWSSLAMSRNSQRGHAGLSLLDLPDLVIRRIITCICFPENSEEERDPRDLFRFVTCCRGLYFSYFEGSSDRIFESYYLELPEYQVYLSKAKPRAAPTAEHHQSRGPLNALPPASKRSTEGKEGKECAHESPMPSGGAAYNSNIEHRSPKPLTSATAMISVAINPANPLELMGFRLSILNIIGLEWLAAFAPKCTPTRRKKATDANQSDYSNCNNSSAIAIMEHLGSYVLGVFGYAISTEMSRWTMLGWTTSRDFLLLHGVVGLYGREFGCPRVVIGKRRYCNAKRTFEMLIRGQYTSLTDDGDIHPVWTGYSGPPDV